MYICIYLYISHLISSDTANSAKVDMKQTRLYKFN